MRHVGTTAAIALVSILCLATGSAIAQGRPSGIVLPAITGGAHGADPSSILVRFEANASSANRANARALVNGSLKRSYSLVDGLERLELHGGLDVARAAAILRKLPFVAYAHPNYVIAADQLPDDEYFAEQWALHNTGQGSMFGVWEGGTADADVDWPEAWTARVGTGSVVAVIDTGIDHRHSDLQANVWLNAAEANGTAGVDDDGNGYVDDIRGWDFVNGDNGPLDGHGHGTHVAGTIAAVANNTRGVTGVMWNGQVMALKILDDSGYGLLSDAVEALQYAVAKGVRVSNNSWGYSEYSPEEEAAHNALRDAIAAARSQGHLFVAAAGNDSVNTDVAPHYPSSFNLDNIVSVTASDNNDQLAWFANTGPASVDLAAPGDNIFSTYKLFGGAIDDYAWLSGTSMSTPHVAGVAGLLFGLQPGWTYQQVRDRILSNTKPVAALVGSSVTGGVLNVMAALDGVPNNGGGGSSLLASLGLGSAVTPGCKSVTGTVTLSGPAPAEGVVVALGDTLASASVPATLTIPAGATTKTFAVNTVPLLANETGTVSATQGGKTLSQSLTVRPIGLTSVTLTPASVVGGNAVVGKATLECKAGPGAILVSLASSNAAVAHPVAASISVPQSLQSATFDVATGPVLARTSATISGTANGIVKSKVLTVTPAASVSPTGLKFGSVSVGTTSSVLNATLSNQGPVAFSVSSIVLTGTYAPWFAQTNNCPASLPAGASCTIGVTFKPLAVASRSAKLSIATSATSTPLGVSLSGTGQ